MRFVTFRKEEVYSPINEGESKATNRVVVLSGNEKHKLGVREQKLFYFIGLFESCRCNKNIGSFTGCEYTFQFLYLIHDCLYNNE